MTQQLKEQIRVMQGLIKNKTCIKKEMLSDCIAILKLMDLADLSSFHLRWFTTEDLVIHLHFLDKKSTNHLKIDYVKVDEYVIKESVGEWYHIKQIFEVYFKVIKKEAKDKNTKQDKVKVQYRDLEK